MRQLSEINKEINELDDKIADLKIQRNVLTKERMEHWFANFCEKYGVQKGDVVKTKRNGIMMVCGIDENWDDWVKVRKIKKNGEPYSVGTTQSQRAFKDCKVIGHIDIED